MGDEIIKVLNDLSEKFGIVIDWTQQNIQPYLQDLMSRLGQYELVKNIIYTVISLVVLFVSIYAFCWGMKKMYFTRNKCSEEDEIIEIFTVILAFLFFVLSLTVLTITTDNIIECIFIPEKVFMEELQKVI